jgi:hypothetical protein
LPAVAKVMHVRGRPGPPRGDLRGRGASGSARRRVVPVWVRVPRGQHFT